MGRTQLNDPFCRLGPHLLTVMDEVRHIVVLRHVPDGANLREEFFAELDNWISIGWEVESLIETEASLRRGGSQRLVELVAVH